MQANLTTPSVSIASLPAPTDVDVHAQIAERAYLRAQARGFVPGQELDDWLAAEAEIAARPNAMQIGA
jgi:hypothetical protein